MAHKEEIEIEIHSPAEKFYNIFKAETHKLPDISSDKLHGVEVHEGDWETHGSLKLWKYTIDGRTETFKERVEIDEPNLSITFVGVEGDIFKDYKSYKATLKATPKAQASLLKISIEYEKKNENVPALTSYLDFLVALAKDIDAHLLNSEKKA